jgi:hypothetical protein
VYGQPPQRLTLELAAALIADPGGGRDLRVRLLIATGQAIPPDHDLAMAAAVGP